MDTFTCEFTTSNVGEHTIEIFIKNEKIDATPNFYTYDATKIKVADIPAGSVGMPVDFAGKINFANKLRMGFSNLRDSGICAMNNFEF